LKILFTKIFLLFIFLKIYLVTDLKTDFKNKKIGTNVRYLWF
jgi:hypothetical protein